MSNSLWPGRPPIPGPVLRNRWAGFGFAISAAFAACSEHDAGEMASSVRENPSSESRSNDEPNEARSSEGEAGARMVAAEGGSSGRTATPAPEAGRSGSAAGSGAATSGGGAPASDGGAAVSGTGGMQQAGGSTAAAGAPAAGAPAAGAPPSIDTSGNYSATKCPNAPTVTADKLAACDGEVTCAGAAHCVPMDRLEDSVSADTLDSMPDCTGGKCMPDLLLGGKFQWKPCTGSLGDGRCLPECFAVTVMPLAGFLGVGEYGCGRQEICVPCGASEASSGLCEMDQCEP